jgi:hypothetical protein
VIRWAPYDMYWICVKLSRPERVSRSIVTQAITCTKRWCFAWASRRRKVQMTTTTMRLTMPHAHCHVAVSYHTTDEVNNLQVIYVVPFDQLKLSPYISREPSHFWTYRKPLLGRPAALQHDRVRAVNSALSCPSAACISLYSDRTASLKGTSLDAHYLSTSHSSGEYEARHSFVPCGGVAARWRSIAIPPLQW